MGLNVKKVVLSASLFYMRKKDLNISISQWRKFYVSKGIKQEMIDVYLSYVQRLLENNAPVIFDFEHLSLLLRIDRALLSTMVNASGAFYRQFTIPKRSGGQREITAPYPSLKYVQSWINEKILSKVPIHGCAHGFVEKRSIITNVSPHMGKPHLLKIDLKDFFPSITINMVIQVFNCLGYTPEVSFYLASLCCHEGVLPQGSPASPVISNIVAKHLDRRLYRLAKRFGYTYTRYADDIAFSGENIFIGFIKYVKEIVEDCGFAINEKKVRLYGEKGNKILTGISMASGRPRVPRDYRRKLEKELFYIRKYGIDAHMNHMKIRSYNYLESIMGRVDFWKMVEPDNRLANEMSVFLRDEYKRRRRANQNV